MNNKEIHILFTGVGRRVELLQAFRQAALVLNINLKMYGADIKRTAPALAYCDYVRIVCGMKEPQYISELVNICQTDSIDLLIPTIDTDLLILSQNVDKFPVFTKVMISRSDMIAICRDKNLTSQFFIDHGLNAPLPVNDYKKYNRGFPAFIKPKDGSSSINSFKVEDEEQLETFANKVDDYIVQPFVAGKEYTIDIFCDWEGNPVFITPRGRLAVRAGEVLKTQIFLDYQMIEESRIICDAFKPCGPITVQLIRDEKGIDWFIEINPRFGGGVPLSMKSGARSAESILRLLCGDNVEYSQPQTNEALYSRFDQSVCIDEGKSNKSIKGVIFDLDDTLYSEKEYIRSGFNKISKVLKKKEAEDTLWSFFEKGRPAIDEYVKENNIEYMKAQLLEVYRNHIPDIHLYKGIREVLDSLRKREIKVGIITDGRPESQRRKLAALGLQNIETIITDELGGEQFRKPCDIAFRIMLTRWKLNPQDVVYVGDNPTKDFQAPEQLGMKWLWFENEDGIYSKNQSYKIEKKINKITIDAILGIH